MTVFLKKKQDTSYLLAEVITQQGKSHTLDEKVIVPACKIIMEKELDLVQEIEKKI